jgi:hypothetical protein
MHRLNKPVDIKTRPFAGESAILRPVGATVSLYIPMVESVRANMATIEPFALVTFSMLFIVTRRSASGRPN